MCMKTHIITITFRGIQRSCLVRLPSEEDGSTQIPAPELDKIFRKLFPTAPLLDGLTYTYG